MKKVSPSAYVEKVNEIYNEHPSYETGGDGSNGVCDCIGMCRGALKRAGATDIHNLRGCNNAVRNNTITNVRDITWSLKVGDVVLKTRNKDDENMPLPDQYRQGGSQYDPRFGETNFTHIGTVTRENPLEITHMTSPSAKKDTSAKGWTLQGELPWVDSSKQPEPSPEPTPTPEPEPDPMWAKVYSKNGKHVHMRKEPSISSAVVDNVPCGADVLVLKYDPSWCYIAYTDKRNATWYGYMMTEFLIIDETKPVDPTPEPTPEPSEKLYTVHIYHLTQEEAEQLRLDYMETSISEE